MSYTKKEVQAKLAAIRDNGGFVTFPEGFKDIESENGELNMGYGEHYFPVGVPFKACIRSRRDKLHITIQDNSGTNDEGYTIGEQEELGDEHIMALLLATDEQTQKLKQLDELELAIGAAAKAYTEFSKQHNLGKDVEWSTDPYTISEWNSSSVRNWRASSQGCTAKLLNKRNLTLSLLKQI